jgi:hypothetical protein
MRSAGFSVLASFTLLLGACAGLSPRQPSGRAVQPGIAATHDEEGRLVRDHLAQRYGESLVDCGSAGSPAFVCSGVILRGTDYSTAYHSWHPNPNSPKGDGVSFSFLRHDAKFDRLAYGYLHGFIVYPDTYKPGVTVHLAVLCSFPIDADTDVRLDKGCGANRKYVAKSGPCQAQGITQAGEWYVQYTAPPAGDNPRQRQCGFDVAQGTTQSAAIFMASIRARDLFSSVSFGVQNEIIIDSWKGTPDRVGVEAFFYSGAQGLADARAEQADFQRTVGTWRPVIKMTLPATISAEASFEYRPADQTP